ncbi:uncharacterized protein LOC135484794 [Lineus longissimus]|uniref:uncharacterized protein LOC135484794 n=1 Tax=Lineus longissimus TaxID=88925 RepID=UPI00315D7412
MKKTDQTHTLFHSWAASKPLTDMFCQTPVNSNNAKLGMGGIQGTPAVLDLCNEGEDDELIRALAMSEMDGEVSQLKATPPASGIQNDSNALTDYPMAEHDMLGFSKFNGRMLTYPTNYPVRDYQLNIVQSAIYRNTLVCLPTGLGKTFIAAVVMYNYFMWYPSGKVVFMAPTKPLVAQQIEACYNIMGIPQTHTAEMTGAMSPVERVKAWQTKRLFFLTPQVMMNDLSRGALPADQVKCLVVDEAHKAQGNHAYCQVVRDILKYSKDFRVLALSATPGSDIKSVQQVITNLCITNIELRTEDSIDIKQYSHERQVDKIVVKLNKAVLAVKQKYMRILKMVVDRLIRMRVLYNKDPESLSKFALLKNRDAFRQNPPESLSQSQYGMVEGDFAMCISLYHGYELLQLHGLKPLYSFLEGIASGEKGFGRSRHELLRNADFCSILEELKAKFHPSNAPLSSMSTQSQPGKPFVSGHPKLGKLQEIVLEHHQKYLEEHGNSNTRIMIFSQYRDSVMEITDMLNQHQPLVKVMNFIGQSSIGKASKGFTQKEQLKVMRQFREGGYNTLVSTCVGEEGLDIGDVDLIICFDAHKSPIRLVQRMGRTGRKRKGRIVMLVTEGKEEMIYKKSLYSKKCIHNAILNSRKSLQFYPNYPRMIPEGHKPALFKTYITVAKAFQSKCSKQMQCRSAISSHSGELVHYKCGQDGLLSKEEWDDYMEKFYVPEASIPIVENTKITCLRPADEEAFVSNDRPVLSLCEWLPWQNVHQETVLVSHSVRTGHLVEIMEFMELQSSLGDDEGGVAYGVEMSAYREEKLLKPEETTIKDNGIMNFLDLAADKDDENTGEKIRQRRIKCMPLPQISSSEEELDTDDELPKFGGQCKMEKKTNSHQSETDAALNIKLKVEATALAMSNKTSKERGGKCAERLIDLDAGDLNRKKFCPSPLLGKRKRKNTEKKMCLVDDIGKNIAVSEKCRNYGEKNAIKVVRLSTINTSVINISAINTSLKEVAPVFSAPLCHAVVDRIQRNIAAAAADGNSLVQNNVLLQSTELGDEKPMVLTKSPGEGGAGKQASMSSVEGSAGLSVEIDRKSKRQFSVQKGLFCNDGDEFEVNRGGICQTPAASLCRVKDATVDTFPAVHHMLPSLVLGGASVVNERRRLNSDGKNMGNISVHEKMSDSITEFSQLTRLPQSTELPWLKSNLGSGVTEPPYLGGLDFLFDELGTPDRLSPLDILQLVDIWEAEKVLTDDNVDKGIKSTHQINYDSNLPNSTRTNDQMKLSVSRDAIKLNPADEMFEEVPSLDKCCLMFGNDSDRSRTDSGAANQNITQQKKCTGQLGCNSDGSFGPCSYVVELRESSVVSPRVSRLSRHCAGNNEVLSGPLYSQADDDKIPICLHSAADDFDNLNEQCMDHAPTEKIRCGESQKFDPCGLAETDELLLDIDGRDNSDIRSVRGAKDYGSCLDKVQAGEKETLVFRNCRGEKQSSCEVSAPCSSEHMLSEVTVSCDTLERTGFKQGSAVELAYVSKSQVSSSVLCDTKDNSIRKVKTVVSPVTKKATFLEAFNVSCSLFDEDFASNSCIDGANSIIHPNIHNKPFTSYENGALFDSVELDKRHSGDDFMMDTGVTLIKKHQCCKSGSLSNIGLRSGDSIFTAVPNAKSDTEDWLEPVTPKSPDLFQVVQMNSSCASDRKRYRETIYPHVAVMSNQMGNITASLLNEDDDSDDNDQLLAAVCVGASKNGTISSEVIQCNTTKTELEHVGAIPENTPITFTQAIDSVLGCSELPEDNDSRDLRLQEPLSLPQYTDHDSKNITNSLSSSVCNAVQGASVNISNHKLSLFSQTMNQPGGNLQENDGPCRSNLPTDELSPCILTKNTTEENVLKSNHGNSSSPFSLKRKICYKDEAERKLDSDDIHKAEYNSHSNDPDLLGNETDDQVERRDTQESCGFMYSPLTSDLQADCNPCNQVKMKNLAVFDSSIGLLTPVIRVPRRKKARLILSESSSDEDLVVKVKSRKDVATSLATTRERFKRKRGQSAATPFIEVEADLSVGFVDSGDEDEDDLDHYDASFVNDNTLLTQSVGQDSFDSQAMYIRSTTNTDFSGDLGRFKLHYKRNVEMDVFSQVREEEESCYSEMDSFINDDVNEDYGVESEAEITICHKRGKESASVSKQKTCTTNMAKGRKRIRFMNSSGSDEHETPVKCIETNTAHSNNPTVLAPCASGQLKTLPANTSGMLTMSGQGKNSTLSCLGNPGISENGSLAAYGYSVDDMGSTSSKVTTVNSGRNFDFKKTANSSRNKMSSLPVTGLHIPDIYLDINTDDDFGGCEPGPTGLLATGIEELWPSFSTKSTNKMAPNASHSSTPVKQVTQSTTVTSISTNNSVQRQLCAEQLWRQGKLEEFQSMDAKNQEQRKKLDEITCKGLLTIKDTPSCNERNGVSNSEGFMIPVSSSSLRGKFQSSQFDDRSKLVILIDSRELSGAQELMSTLRLMHKQNVFVCQLLGCNYAVSNRMGVERKVISDLVNGAKKSKLVDRLRYMCDLYDRPVLIIEKDRIKPGEVPHKKTFFRSKYVENMLASLSQSHIKVLYSDSQEETANLLSKLCLQESKKNMSISRSPTMADQTNQTNEQVMKFYLSMPNVNYTMALNMFHNYKTIAAFLHSPVELMQIKGCMSRARAIELHRFIRHKFDLQLLPNPTDE